MFTENEDLRDADIIVNRLGDPNGKKGLLKSSKRKFEFDGVIYLSTLLAYFNK
ncbi:MAG TPA: hypothetical protein EYP18_11550 [Desulfobacterales bacterium]|nr:hypothetical protein [Desulfobacterales bacterium]